MTTENSEKLGCLVLCAIFFSPVFIIAINIVAILIVGKAIEHGAPNSLKACEFAQSTIGYPLKLALRDETP